ncbi:MAG: U32 family peptidase, partial [Gammaproteobacteria bacterium]
NQGTCTNACRWKYQAHEATEDEAGNVIAQSVAQEWSPDENAPTLGEGDTSSRIFLLQEGNDPSRLMPAYEDEHGTYIMNSKDLRAIHHVPRLTEIGVHSLKIEGRTKSFYYVARTAQAYRKAIDDAVAGRPFDMRLMDDLEKLAHRGYTEGFYRRHVHDEYQNYEKGHSTAGRQQFVGEAIEYDADDHALIVEVKNRFAKGDTIELMTPAGNREFRLDHLENLKGQAVDVAPGSGHTVKVFLPEDAPRSAKFTLLMRNF